ncbi:unnamed protein product, partial [Meganyctiphanes norvegica]
MISSTAPSASEESDGLLRSLLPSSYGPSAPRDADLQLTLGRKYSSDISHPPLPNEQLPCSLQELFLCLASVLFDPGPLVGLYLWMAVPGYCCCLSTRPCIVLWIRLRSHDRRVLDLAPFRPLPLVFSAPWGCVHLLLALSKHFTFLGQSFSSSRSLTFVLPDKTIAQLVKYYYLWKKTRQRSSLIDRHARKHQAKLQEGLAPGGSGDSTGDRSDEEDDKKGDDQKMCSNCTIHATILNETAKGMQCNTCYTHWKKQGTLRPTVGPMKRDKQLIKSKRRPPRGMHINHEDLMAMVNAGPPAPQGSITPGQQLLRHMENEVIALKRQVQSNKAQISNIRTKVPEEGITGLRPPANPGPPKAKWSQEELLLAVQAVRHFGQDFKAIAEIVGNKTENHVRSFFVTYRKRYNLDVVLREWDDENGPV